jgi:hypothetical protein
MATAIRLVATLLALLLPVPAGAERITSFDSDIQVNADGSMLVSESIQVTVEGQEVKRGILRDFPTTYTTPDGRTIRVGFEVLEVRRNGEPEPYRIEPLRNGERVRIGQAHVLLPLEPQTYEITYRTDRQLGFFEDHDELYWNVTGNGWTLPIGRATARVSLPGDAPIVAIDGFTGPQGWRAPIGRKGHAGRAWSSWPRPSR